MRIMGRSYYKEFRQLKPSKKALQRELKINDDEWLMLRNLEERPCKPVDVTTGNDENRDGLAIDRPAGVPRNSMHGPSYVSLDVNLGHDFPLTKEGSKGPTTSVTLNSFNVLNHPNDMTYIGVVGSPFYGQAVAAQPPRRMQLNIEFRF